MDGVELILGDCLDVMRGMDAESIDCVVTSPPYGIAKEYETDNPQKQLQENVTLIENSFQALSRIVKPGGVRRNQLWG